MPLQEFDEGDHLLLVFVQNPDGSRGLLAVKDLSRDNPQWKVPGGGAQPGESVVVAACRENHEETGVPVPLEEAEYLGSMTGYNKRTDETYEITLSKVTVTRAHVEQYLDRDARQEDSLVADVLPIPLDGSGREFLAAHRARIEKVAPDLARSMFW